MRLTRTLSHYSIHVNTRRSAERPVGVPHPRARARRAAARVAAGLTHVRAARRGRRWPSSARVRSPHWSTIVRLLTPTHPAQSYLESISCSRVALES